MSRQLPNPGTYPARRTGPMVVQESKDHALMLYIPYALISSEISFQSKHSECIGAKDGSLQSKKIATLRKIFPEWDGVNLAALQTIPLPAALEDGSFPAEFELADCFHDDSFVPPGEKEPVIQFKAQWLNPLGGSSNMPEPLDEKGLKELQTRWGSKLKAASGATAPTGKPSAAKDAKNTTAAAKSPGPSASTPKASGGAPSRPASGGPPGRNATTAQARTSTQDEVWNALVKANGGDDADQNELGNKFYEAQDRLVPDAAGGKRELTITEWGAVADDLGV
jgi:hypothetical protein